jgi:hypothetical protein
MERVASHAPVVRSPDNTSGTNDIDWHNHLLGRILIVESRSHLKKRGESRKAIRVGASKKVKAMEHITEKPMEKVTDFPAVNFNGGCGEAPGHAPYCAVSAGMQPFQSASVNGGPVSNCVIGNDGAKIFEIWLTTTTGPVYTYQVTVNGQGPSGLTSGSFYLAFTDESGDTYYLSLYSSTRENHIVDYNSDKPNIMKIWWCDYSFDVPSSNTTKPDYRVTTPANK